MIDLPQGFSPLLSNWEIKNNWLTKIERDIQEEIGIRETTEQGRFNFGTQTGNHKFPDKPTTRTKKPGPKKMKRFCKKKKAKSAPK